MAGDPPGLATVTDSEPGAHAPSASWWKRTRTPELPDIRPSSTPYDGTTRQPPSPHVGSWWTLPAATWRSMTGCRRSCTARDGPKEGIVTIELTGAIPPFIAVTSPKTRME